MSRMLAALPFSSRAEQLNRPGPGVKSGTRAGKAAPAVAKGMCNHFSWSWHSLSGIITE